MRHWAIIALLLLPGAAVPAATPAAPHTFTDQFGRTLAGEIVEVSGPQVKVRRDDGQSVALDIAQLTDADAAYVTRWEREHRVYRLHLEASTFHRAVGSNQSHNTAQVVQDMEMGYEIRLTNDSSTPAAELRLEYNVFVVRRSPVPNSEPTQIRIKARGTVDTLALKQTATVRTSPIPYTKTESMVGNNSPALEIRGAWVRVIFDGRVVAEYLSSEKLRSEGWQEIATVPSRGLPAGG